MSTYKTAALLLIVVGALNWGLIGLANFNLVGAVLGTGSVLERLIYVLVGIAGFWILWNHWIISSAKLGKKK